MLQGGNTAELILPAVPEQFPVMRDWLEARLNDISAPAAATKKLLIAAEEIFTNIAFYAYPDHEGEIRTTVRFLDGIFTLVFADCGIPFNPLAKADPNISEPISERPIGGLGILLVKKLMDKVEYSFENGWNQLSMCKDFSAEATKQ